MRGSCLFFSCLATASVRSGWFFKYGSARPGTGLGYNYRSYISNQFTKPDDWDQQWESVEVPAAPPAKLVVEWPNNVRIEPGDFANVDWMTTRPKLKWEAERGALYSVVLLDAGIKRVLPEMFFHWGVSNIPGNMVSLGNEVMEYITPFSLEFDENNKFITDRQKSSHPLLMLVFKQKSGKIFVDETHSGCNPEILDRILNYQDLAKKYELELVAGNLLQMPYSGYSTHDMICRITKCTRSVFPFPIPGVNDLPECQPRVDIMDITVRGPRLDNLGPYAKYTSAYSLDSVTHVIQDTAPAGSTGLAIEYTALEGAFNGSDFGTNNLADIYEGIVDATLFTYTDKKATEGLFFGEFPSVIEVIRKTIPELAPPGALTVVLSKPEDQDFDFQNIIKKPGMVFEMLIVKVKDDKEKEFRETRDKMITIAHNTKLVENVYKFDVDRDVLVDPRSVLPEEVKNIELTIMVYPSKSSRNKFKALMKDSSDFQQFVNTFECKMCALMVENRRPEYFPPFE